MARLCSRPIRASNSLYLQNVPLVVNTSTSPAGYTVGPPINANESSLAHRDRKINLNYPLPVSNDPNESTRQKWISESYQVLKQILPPLSLDTPEEIGQLSQFLINVVNFRDPDATMTHWQNPDVVIVPGSNSARQRRPPTWPSWAPSPPERRALRSTSTAWSTARSRSTGCWPSRTVYSVERDHAERPSVFELVNNLTSPAAASLATSTSNPSTLDLSGFAYTLGDPYSGGCWDLVFTADDPESRPDLFRGDLVAGATSNAKWYGLLPLTRDTFGGLGREQHHRSSPSDTRDAASR